MLVDEGNRGVGVAVEKGRFSGEERNERFSGEGEGGF